jgi:hypothetical protein
MGGNGKWCWPNVPHKGWTCTDVYDLGGDYLGICEMCETQEIRYVHVMTHPDYDGELGCGCVCAGNMEENLTGAQEREKKLKLRSPERIEIANSWLKATSAVLAAGNLRERELEFVRDIHSRATHCALPRSRKKFSLTDKQMRWFRSIYLRVVGRQAA